MSIPGFLVNAESAALALSFVSLCAEKKLVRVTSMLSKNVRTEF